MVLGSQKNIFGKLRKLFKISEKNFLKIFFLGDSNRNSLKVPNAKNFFCSGLKILKSKKILTQKIFFLLKNNFFYSCSRITQERSRTILGALKDLFASFLTNFSKIKIITFQSCSAKFGRFFVGGSKNFFEKFLCFQKEILGAL